MEDAHIVQLSAVGDDQASAFFALFDGHGGAVKGLIFSKSRVRVTATDHHLGISKRKPTVFSKEFSAYVRKSRPVMQFWWLVSFLWS